MVRGLFLLFIIVPALEIWVLILSGRWIGVPLTILIIILTGLLGARLARKEGLDTLRRAQEQMSYGQVPGESLLDGICVIVGGVLLLTPGFITDITGFLLLYKPTRRFAKNKIKNWLKRKIDRGDFTFFIRR